MDLLSTIVVIIVLITTGIVGLTTRNWFLVLVLAGIAVVGTQNWTLPIPLLIITGVVALTVRNTRAAMRETAQYCSSSDTQGHSAAGSSARQRA